jgi:PAS domain S-box-containing protein
MIVEPNLCAMLDPLVIAYVGEEQRGLDLVRALDRRSTRPVHLLTADPSGVASVVERPAIDAVVCGPVGGEERQRVVDRVADTASAPPVFELGGAVVAAPDSVELHRVTPGDDLAAAADALVSEALGSPDREPRTLGRHLAVDGDWTVTDWDPRLESLTGVPPSAAVGTSLWDAVPDWAGTQLAGTLRAVHADGGATTTELFHEPADSRLALRAVALETGGIECFLRVRTEASGPEERFADTVERITDAFFALDNQDRFVLLNDKAEELLEVDQDEVTGVRLWDAFPAALGTSFYEEFREAMETQEPASFEEYYQPQGRWFEVNAYPSREGLSVFLRDVTEQRELRGKLEALHDVTRELIVAESDDAIAARTVEAAEEVLDFPLVAVWRHDDATGKLDPLAWSDPIVDRDGRPEPRGPDSEFLWEVYESGERRHLGFVPATTSSSHHPGKVDSELLVPVGEYGVIGAYADERDAFDEADVELFRLLASTVESAFARTLRERQLARRNERLDDFASVVSHDLRNPLNVATGHVDLARDADDADEHLDTIADSLDRMETLIEDLLARARADRGVDREPLSLATVAREAWEGIDSADATLELGADIELAADPARLRQLFENLFRNSVEHGSATSRAQSDDAGDTVTVRVDTYDDGFFVADDGPGIPEEDRAEIFERGVTHAADGNGYGLAIVADVADGHDWRVSAGESEDGGARFEISGIRSLADAQQV